MLLGPLKLRDTFLRLSGVQEGQTVVDSLSGGARREIQRFPELIHGLGRCRRILIERFPEISGPRKTIRQSWFGLETADQQGGSARKRNPQNRADPPHCFWTPFPSTTLLILFTATPSILSTRPLGQ